MLLLSLAAEVIYSLLITLTGRAASVCGSGSAAQTLLQPWELGHYYPSRPPSFLTEGGAVGSVGAQVGLKALCDAQHGGWDRVSGEWCPPGDRLVETPVL